MSASACFFKQAAFGGDGSHEALMESNPDYASLVNVEDTVG
jgi:hypothetical protein